MYEVIFITIDKIKSNYFHTMYMLFSYTILKSLWKLAENNL